MEVDYGYGEAVPDSEVHQAGVNYTNTNNNKEQDVMEVDYGYGDAAPDVRTTNHSFNNEDEYGYGYNDDRELQHRSNSCQQQRFPRRSSMKQQGIPRRASIGYTGEITVSLPGRHEPVRRRTSISFQETDQVKEVEPTPTLTDQPEQLWFQPHEYDMIQEKALLLTNLASRAGGSQLIAEKKLCTRGLECHIDRKTVEEEQYLAWKSVFMEQYYQRNHGIYNEELVSQIYQLATMESQSRALYRAQTDFAEAEKYTRTTRNEMMIMRRRHSMVC